MVNYNGNEYHLEAVGESSFEIEFEENLKLKNMEDLKKKWYGVEFISTCGKSKMVEQFAQDFKKAVKSELGKEYKIKTRIGHFEISGFISKNEKYVYFNIGDLREKDNGFGSCLFRTAENEKDYRGGYNRFCRLNNLADEIQYIIGG